MAFNGGHLEDAGLAPVANHPVLDRQFDRVRPVPIVVRLPQPGGYRIFSFRGANLKVFRCDFSGEGDRAQPIIWRGNGRFYIIQQLPFPSDHLPGGDHFLYLHLGQALQLLTLQYDHIGERSRGKRPHLFLQMKKRSRVISSGPKGIHNHLLSCGLDLA